MKKQKQIALQLAVFVTLLAIFWLLLIVAALIPNNAIQKNMTQSALYYKERDAFSFENGTKWNSISDNYADAILLNVSWHLGKGNPFKASLDTWYYDGETLGENVGLYRSVLEDEIQPNTDYSRYWHGTAMLVRFLHLFTDVRGVKLCGFLGMLLLAFGTVGILLKHRQEELAVTLLVSLAAIQIWNLRLSMEYQPAFLLAFLFCVLYLWLERKGDSYLTLLAVAGGVSIAFFDFLTTETVVLLLPLILVVSVRTKENRLGDWKDSIRMLVHCGICWLSAYAGTFFVKWTAASLVTGSNKFLLAFSSVEERMTGSLSGEGTDHFLLRVPQAVVANLTMMFGGESRIEPGRVVVGLFISTLILGSLLYLFYHRGNPTAIKLLMILGSVVFLRYIILNNHSYLHEFFTYRALISPVMAVLAGSVLSMQIPRPVKRKGRKQ